MRQRDVADELSAAAQVAVVLLADEPRANALSGHAVCRVHGEHLSICTFLGQAAARKQIVARMERSDIRDRRSRISLRSMRLRTTLALPISSLVIQNPAQ